MKGTVRVLLGVVALGLASDARAQGVIVDHRSLALFDQIPDQYLRAAADLAMVFINRSVGGNINDGLTCLDYDSDAAAPTSCKRFVHPVSQFSSPQSEVQWLRPGGGYDRARWQYFGWPGSGIPPEMQCGGVDTGNWRGKLECFIAYVDQNPTQFRVYSYMNSYLEVDTTSDIASGSTGYFARGSRVDIGEFEALEARHPSRVFVHHTTSLARGIGTQVATDFNNQLRQYARDHNKFLLDVADIESHDPWGSPCYDNRDGVLYNVGTTSENYPNDGQNQLALCQHYTRETDGGHLGNPDVGKIRLAKAYWVLMAQIAGWRPSGGSTTLPAAPTNLRIVP